MRIDINSFATIGTLQDSTPAQRSTTAHTSNEHTDGVTAQLSSDSKTVSSVASGDDIRQDRVAALKQAIDAGTYRANAAATASAMMDNLLNTRFTL